MIRDRPADHPPAPHIDDDDGEIDLAGVDSVDRGRRTPLAWLVAFVDQDRAWRREIRQLEAELDRLLDEHGTTLRDEPRIGPVAATTLICEVGDPTRFDRESKFARWYGTGAVALSSGEGDRMPVRHRLDHGGNRRINSVLYIASVTQQRDCPPTKAYLERKITEGKTRRATNAISRTASSATRGPTRTNVDHDALNKPLDKGASDSPRPAQRRRYDLDQADQRALLTLVVQDALGVSALPSIGPGAEGELPEHAAT